MIQPRHFEVGDIFKLSEQLVVPQYQREYTWRSSEAEEFWGDLESTLKTEDDTLFLGTIIFDISDSKESKIIKVVDGQQRITTLLLLLIACREAAKNMGASEIAVQIQQKITLVDETTGESKDCRLTASESIRDLLEHMSDSEWNREFPPVVEKKRHGKVIKKQVKRQANRIRPIYNFFYDKISSFDKEELSGLLRAIFKKSYVIRIDIENEVEAFSIFERTNARGVDLEASDLLKNYLFAAKVEGLEEVWPQIIENSEGTILRMLKYFYVSKQGYVSKSDLYKKIRAYGKGRGSPELVQELDAFAKYYKVIRTAKKDGIKDYFQSIDCPAIASDQDKYERIYYSLEGLRLFKISQVYPLIYAAIECFSSNGGGTDKVSAKKLIHFFDVLERYHFVNNAVCERIGNEVEKLYADFCKKFQESSDFAGSVNELVAALKSKRANETEFVSRFSEISYSNENIPLIAYIFDRINNKSLDPGQRVSIYDSDPKVLRKNHNIEHFYPQNPDGRSAHDPEGDVIDNIGNLLAINFRTNSKLGNLKPSKKMDKLKTDLNKEIQNKSYIQDFINDYEGVANSWNNEVIEERAKKLANDAYNTVWTIS